MLRYDEIVKILKEIEKLYSTSHIDGAKYVLDDVEKKVRKKIKEKNERKNKWFSFKFWLFS